VDVADDFIKLFLDEVVTELQHVVVLPEASTLLLPNHLTGIAVHVAHDVALIYLLPVLVLLTRVLAARLGVNLIIVPRLAIGKLVGADEVCATILQIKTVQPHTVLAVESAKLTLSHITLSLLFVLIRCLLRNAASDCGLEPHPAITSRFMTMRSTLHCCFQVVSM